MNNLVVINGQNVELEVQGADQVTTTSFKIASVFNKRHGDIIRKIELMPDDEFRQRNFALSQKPLQNGLFKKDTKYYKITRDGFVMLAMGFTGDKAYRFKVEYINAFNQMQRLLKMNFNNRMSRSVMIPQLDNKREQNQKEQVLKSENESLKDELINTQKELIRLYQMGAKQIKSQIDKRLNKLNADTIKEIRKLYYEKGFTQKEVARLLGIGTTSVYKYTRINEQGEFNE